MISTRRRHRAALSNSGNFELSFRSKESNIPMDDGFSKSVLRNDVTTAVETEVSRHTSESVHEREAESGGAEASEWYQTST